MSLIAILWSIQFVVFAPLILSLSVFFHPFFEKGGLRSFIVASPCFSGRTLVGNIHASIQQRAGLNHAIIRDNLISAKYRQWVFCNKRLAEMERRSVISQSSTGVADLLSLENRLGR